MVVGKAVKDWHNFHIGTANFEDVYEETPAPLHSA